MTILEILEAHESRLLNYACSCGAEFPPPNEHGRPYLKYRAHVAEVLEKHIQEREAEARADECETVAQHVGHPPLTEVLMERANEIRWKADNNGR